MNRQSPEILEPPRPEPAEHHGRGVLFMTLSLVLFTANTLLLKYFGTRADVSIWLALIGRAAVGFILTYVIVLRAFKRVDLAPFFTDRLMVWRGIFGIVGTACFYWTIPALGAGKSTLIGSTYIIFAALLAVFFLKETLSRSATLWMIVALCGVGLLTCTNGDGSSPGAAVFGLSEMIAILGAVNAAAAVVVIRKLVRNYSSAAIYLCQCVYLLIFSLPLLPFLYQWPGWLNLGLILAGGVSATAGQIAMNQGYRYLPVATGASIQMALPVTASIGGVILFQETFTSLQMVGAVLIVFGCYRVVVGRRK